MEEHDDEGSVISTVFTPIFFSDDASMTETEREKGGRTRATEPVKEVEEGGTRVWRKKMTKKRVFLQRYSNIC